VSASVSIGVACYPEDGRTLDMLAARADRALYQAKQQGRNKVVRYQPSK
jgi:diguanylate cyclase (GGDEF)-like protein